jgi:septal ring factor EnvC (AmiA/AmiB activator)
MKRTSKIRLLTVTGAIALAAAGAVTAGAGSSSSQAATIGALGSQLNQQRARQESLAASVANLSQLIASLDSQISLVESREAAVRVELAKDRAALLRIRAQLEREKQLISILKARLARARTILANQLVSSYEGDTPDIVTVVLEANGFNDLLEKLAYLHTAEQQQQTMIKITTEAKAAADSAERRMARLEATDERLTEQAAMQEKALAGMNVLLHSRQAALERARVAQQTALDASRARGRELLAEISKLRAEQAAAAAAAAAAIPAPGRGPVPVGNSATLGSSGGWTIPYPVVLCESGGQDLTPNSAGASGYYQIMPATWKLFGGAGSAAYLASKSEQDAVASRIWNGGSGASNWVCAGIVGIH